MQIDDSYILDIKKSINNILVAVRVRPLSNLELTKCTPTVVEILDSNVLILLDPDQDRTCKDILKTRTKEKHYAFDIVFSPDTCQEVVYHKSSEFLVEGVLSGYNASVFAYGPTGTGKTYTMIGEPDKPGIMLQTFSSLFEQAEKVSRDRDFKIAMSYLEIYNENIRDLLLPNREGLEIREDPERGIVVSQLSEVLASSAERAMKSIRNGNKRRTCEPTKANQTSSRSHAILQIVVESRDKAQGISSEIVMGKLSLVDLAGSERAANTRNRGLRLIEGANINKSLLALGNCINALCDMNEKGGKVFIPYRDSKLTRILKDSLGGNCRTVMITCISPGINNFEETYNTLIYANRAKNIKTKVEKNRLNVQNHISKYADIIKQLKSEISSLRTQLETKMPKKLNIESFLIEISKHFQEEARLRKSIYQNEQKIDNIGFTLFAKQTELFELSEEHNAVNGLKEEVDMLRSNVSKLEGEIEELRKKLYEIEARRNEFEVNWISAGINENYLLQLRLEYKKHMVLMNSLDIEGKETHSKLVIERKDMYIKLLEEQLKLRDTLIENEIPKLDHKTLKQIKSYQQINSYFFPESSSCTISPKKTKIVLPSLKRTRIPKVGMSFSPKVSRKRIESIVRKEDHKPGSDLRYSKKYKSRNRINSVESLITDISASSTYADQKPRVISISDKYIKSPYMKSGLFSTSPKHK